MGNIGPVKKAIEAFDAALEVGADDASTRGERVTKHEMEAAAAVLKLGGKLDSQSRMEVWAKLAQRSLTDGAQDVAEAVAGPRPAPAAPAGSAAALADGFEALAKDLLFTSESDYPYEAFHAPLDRSRPFDDANFRAALGLSADVPVRFDPADEFFDDQKSEDVNDAADAAKYAALEAAMKRDLTVIRLVYVHGEDVVDAPVYLVGRARDGSLVGLESRRIWT